MTGRPLSEVLYIVDPETGCWMWQRGKNSKGYGTMWDKTKQKKRRAHIVFYERKYGPVPAGMVLDHIVCDRKSCVNPDHVSPRTNRENLLRGMGPNIVANRAKTCTRGHLIEGDNAIVTPQGRRRCRICRNALNRTLYHRHSNSSRHSD